MKTPQEKFIEQLKELGLPFEVKQFNSGYTSVYLLEGEGCVHGDKHAFTEFKFNPKERLSNVCISSGQPPGAERITLYLNKETRKDIKTFPVPPRKLKVKG